MLQKCVICKSEDRIQKFRIIRCKLLNYGRYNYQQTSRANKMHCSRILSGNGNIGINYYNDVV